MAQTWVTQGVKGDRSRISAPGPFLAPGKLPTDCIV